MHIVVYTMLPDTVIHILTGSPAVCAVWSEHCTSFGWWNMVFTEQEFLDWSKNTTW